MDQVDSAPARRYDSQERIRYYLSCFGVSPGNTCHKGHAMFSCELVSWSPPGAKYVPKMNRFFAQSLLSKISPLLKD